MEDCITVEHLIQFATVIAWVFLAVVIGYFVGYTKAWKKYNG